MSLGIVVKIPTVQQMKSQSAADVRIPTSLRVLIVKVVTPVPCAGLLDLIC